jgi:hypothetical protein
MKYLKLSVVAMATLWSGLALTAPVKIFWDDFETGNLSKWSYSADKVSQAEVHSGQWAFFYDGWPGTEVRIQPTREVYFSLWWYFPPRFQGGWGAGRHFWRLDQEGGTQGQIDTQAQSPPNGFSIVYHDMGGTSGGWYPDVAQLPIGKWFRMEFYSRLNDPGAKNGETALWVDGEQKMWDKNLMLTNSSNRFFQFRMTTNYANTGTCPNNNANCNWFIDDVEIWNGCPPGSPCGD